MSYPPQNVSYPDENRYNVMKSGLCRGKLKKWNDERGFGFIQPMDGSPEVFLHISDIQGATRRPQVEDTIDYYLMTERNGKLRADRAFIVDARKKSSQSLQHPVKPATFGIYPLPIIPMSLLSLLPLLGSIDLAMKTENILPLILYPTMSLVTFCLYADDKSRAKQGKWRTSEQTLHLCELAGGWIGGFAAQRRFHHKSRKKSYQIQFWAIVGVHYIGWLFWLFFGNRLMVG